VLQFNGELNMATFTGKDGAFYIGATGSVLVGEVRDWSLEQTSARVDATVMGDEWTSGKMTQKSWTASVNIYYDAALVVGLGSDITLKLYPQGNTSGFEYYEGPAQITGFNSSASFDGMIEASISVEGNGPLQTLTA
jgi:hypothetical protein